MATSEDIKMAVDKVHTSSVKALEVLQPAAPLHSRRRGRPAFRRTCGGSYLPGRRNHPEIRTRRHRHRPGSDVDA